MSFFILIAERSATLATTFIGEWLNREVHQSNHEGDFSKNLSRL